MARSRHARVASPTIADVLSQFLAEQQRRLAPRTFAQYRDVVDLLRHSLNGYGYQSLDAADARLFDELYNATNDAHLEFCDIFGPAHILPNVGEFLGYFMARKVVAGKDLLRTAGTVTKRLAGWLAEKGYAAPEAAASATERGRQASRDLPNASELASLLQDFAEAHGWEEEEEDMEDYFTVTRVERGKVWLHGMSDDRDIGPITVPEEITRRCTAGWTISGVVGRRGKRWRLVEAWNVYPR